MKIMHLGDLHLGKTLGEFDLYDDQKYIIDQILKIADDEKPEVVVIAGDVYDKSVPSEKATGLLDYFLNELAGRKLKVFMISGNHDSDDRLNFGSSLFESSDIYIGSVFSGRLFKHTLKDEYGDVNIFLLPFVKASQVRHYYSGSVIENYDDAVRLIINNEDIDKKARNILVSHQFVGGKDSDPVLGGSEGVSVRFVGLVEKIGYDIFEDFDYTALGHIHRSQKVGSQNIRYCGSPLKYSLSEAENSKTVTLITLGRKGDISIRERDLKPLRDLRHIKGRLRDLLDKDNIKDVNDFIYVTLTDEDILDDAMGIFRQVYPNTVKIDYDNSRTHDADMTDISRVARNIPFSELIGDFYKMIYGIQISDEEMEMMRSAAKEAGVLNEAD